MIVYKKTDEWYIEWQRVTTNNNEWYNEWERMTASDTASDNKWQQIAMRERASDSSGAMNENDTVHFKEWIIAILSMTKTDTLLLQVMDGCN